MPSSADVLRPFFAHPAHPPGTPSLDEVRGFLFAIAHAPEVISPSQWFPAVFGDEESILERVEDASTITTALMAEYEAVCAAAAQPVATLPAGCVLRDDALANFEADAPIAPWSRGFMEGYRWLEDTWAAYLPGTQSEADREFHGAVTVLGFFSSRSLAEALCATASATDLSALSDGMRRAFPHALTQYAAIGRSLQQAPPEDSGPQRRDTPKVGRNDPCPCGSGRKFKRCCGARA